MLNERDYVVMVEMVKFAKTAAKVGVPANLLMDILETMLIGYFATDNPAFSVEKFIEACKI